MDTKLISTNRFANFNFFLLEKYEAGIVLRGCEIKSVRENGIRLDEAFIVIKNNEMFLKNSFIKSYQTKNSFLPEVDRDRKLLLSAREILKLKQKREEKGLTIIPVRAYLKGKLLKIEIALAKGKKLFNKKEDKKEQDIKRETDRILSRAN